MEESYNKVNSDICQLLGYAVSSGLSGLMSLVCQLKEDFEIIQYPELAKEKEKAKVIVFPRTEKTLPQ